MSDEEELRSHVDPMGEPPEKVDDLIAILSELAREERRIRIASSRPAESRVKVGGDVFVDPEPASALGYTMSSELLRLVGPAEEMGSRYPVTRAIRDRLPAWCAKKHRIAAYHDGGNRPVCAEIVTRVVLSGFSPEEVARGEGIDRLRFDRFLRAALREVWYGARETMIHG